MAGKRRLFGWALLILLGLGVVATVTTYYVATRSNWGRQKFVRWAIGGVNGAFGGRGTLRVGVLRELSQTVIRAGDVSLLDSTGAVVVHVKELRGQLDFSELFARIVHIRQLDVSGVTIALKKDFTGPWNLSHIINGGPKSPPSLKARFGDDIQIDALSMTDTRIDMQYPWSPNAMFTGQVRDSVIKARTRLHDLVITPQGIIERRKIQLPRAVAHKVLLATPGDAPSSLVLDSLGATISDPAVRVVQTSGQLTWTSDSLLLKLPVVTLPASRATAEGTLSWYNPGPVRFDVLTKADAALSDLGWIWDVLPAEGRGTATVRLRTLENPDNAEYTLTKLEVSSAGSHVSGAIAVVSRPADLLLHSVDLTFAPIRSELMRRLSYDAVPKEVKGALRGRLVASKGGPLTALLVDNMNATFDDENIPGARAFLTASGLIGFGVKPTARNIRVQNVQFDLRSLRAFAPAMPVVDGVVQGSTFIASADVNQATVPELQMQWTDGAGNVSRVNGRLMTRYAEKVPFIDTELTLDPVVLKAIARVDSTFPIAATLRGKVAAIGRLDSLGWSANVADGTDRLNGRGLASWRDSVWSVRGTSDFESVNMRTWLGRAEVPITNLNGPVQFGVTAKLRPDTTTRITEAQVVVNLRQPEATDRPAVTMQGSAVLTDERLVVDSANMTMGGILLNAHGALARERGLEDTLLVSVRADTLAKARAELVRLAGMLTPVDSAFSKTLRAYATDTLKGDVSLSGYLAGALPAYTANLTLSARRVTVGAINVGRVFGSLRATGLPDSAHFETVATVDDVSGLGPLQLSTGEFRIDDASAKGGRLSLNITARDTTALRVKGDFTRNADVLAVKLDTLHFRYSDVRWLNSSPATLTSTPDGLRIDSLLVRSNRQGLLSLNANVPKNGAIDARLRVERFPIGEVASFALGAPEPYYGLLTGDSQLSGTRLSPLLSWRMNADSVGNTTAILPPLVTIGAYENKRLEASAVLADSVNRRVRAVARVPIDLSIQSVEKRLLSDSLDAELVVDSLQLAGLPIVVQHASRIEGVLDGRVALSGNKDRPVANGRLTLNNFSALFSDLGIQPREGRMVLVATDDQLRVEQFRMRSGPRLSDTLSAVGTLRFPVGKPTMLDSLRVTANNVVLANKRDGTDLILSGQLSAQGPLKRPVVEASLIVPRANLIIDPLGARAALDLNSAQARDLLGATEVPIAQGTFDPVARLGQYFTVRNASVQLGEEVWVRTPESAVKLGGLVNLKTDANNELAPEGEVTANRGIFRMDLGVVSRNFTIDSGRVRFYGTNEIPYTLGIYATHIVRVANGEDTPVHVTISGNRDSYKLNLSSDDEVFGNAPESEVISLLIFGAPTFALNGQNQSTVKTVTGVFLPSVGGLFEGTLQRLLPIFNTVQLNTAGGQDDLTKFRLLDNLSIAAGKQLGDRTFLRLNTGVCRGSAQNTGASVSLWYGIAAEYRISRGYTAQVGVDPGTSPCTRLGGDVLPRMQFGFDLFRDWIF